LLKEKIIEILNTDLKDEHGAIIQYLAHAYAVGECVLGCEIEAIARDEMRHLDWLAETIVELGGLPSLERSTMNMTGKTVPDWMSNDAGLEHGAIEHYEEHIKLIEDPVIKRLLNRIVSDEKSHRDKFRHFVEKAGKEGLKDIRGSRQDATTDTLNWASGHEYTVILQYMFHSYMTDKAEPKKQLEDQAVNAMQHLGWLAEETVSGGGSPKIEHTEVDLSTDTADMLKADVKIEQDVIGKYDRAAKQTDDPGLRDLLMRIRSNEKYHLDVFNDLLKKEEKQQAP
jgi:bacterioferritin